ncbi:MAG: hypothetical protein A2622_07475 [Bdellovibrionales bacterium RIFCSPHIGHO2_01_FULL_40_29]|nr:MAG: hypothetical protein A2622_07475 [Bdellovibrionales bacterium RIFCSPHIGHO2_01_FULL_40_29]OFZ34323.1 MAG: hypothetical protein A3D17_04175 [Bdellovibrionales bacterium RIFCSPHIGHO2_02_FULL_40_15]
MGPISFGGFLRSSRTMKNLTQKEMAEYLGVSKSTLCDIEKGRQFVSIELAYKIAKKCGLSEAMAVECTVRDQIKRSGLNLYVQIKKLPDTIND